LADAYGSGPYGATRGGSSPLVSKFGGSKMRNATQLESDRTGSGGSAR